MDKFIRLTAVACPLDIANLNSDQLLPARFLKLPRSAGLGTVLLHDLRFDAEGRERPDFPLNRLAWRDAKTTWGAPQLRLRLFARGGGLCALRLRHSMRNRAILRRHLCRQCGAERIIDSDHLRRRSGHAYDCAWRRGGPAPDR